MQIQYHQKSLRLLELDKRFNTQVQNIPEITVKNPNKLPESVYEWAILHHHLGWAWKDEWMKAPEDILHFYSIGDFFWYNHQFTKAIDFDDPDVETYAYKNQVLIPFATENQNNFYLAYILDGSPDPTVFYSAYHREQWVPYTRSFSDFVFAQIYDWQFQIDFLPNWEKEIGLYKSLDFESKEQYETLLADCTREPSTYYYWNGQEGETHRFSFNPEERIVVFVYDNRISAQIMALDFARAKDIKQDLESRMSA